MWAISHQRTPSFRTLSAMACFTALVVSRAAANEPPTLEQIKTHLGAQREKIESLYIEVTAEGEIIVTPDVLVSLLGDSAPLAAPKEENHFAYKGEKRFRRRIRPPEVRLIRPDPSQGKDTGDSMRIRNPDRTCAYNGRTYWSKTIEMGENVFEVGRKTGLSPPLYMKRIGLHVPAPYIKDKDLEFQPVSLLPELFEKWPYAVSDNLTILDGTQCVVLDGTIVLHDANGKATRIPDRLWLDVERGFALRQRERELGDVLYRVVNSRFEEVLPGYWFPKRSLSQGFRIADRERPFSETHLQLTKVVVNKVRDELFEMDLKPGDRVKTPADLR